MINPSVAFGTKFVHSSNRYLEKKVFQEYSDRLCLITPDVTQFIKLYEGLLDETP